MPPKYCLRTGWSFYLGFISDITQTQFVCWICPFMYEYIFDSDDLGAEGEEGSGMVGGSGSGDEEMGSGSGDFWYYNDFICHRSINVMIFLIQNEGFIDWSQHCKAILIRKKHSGRCMQYDTAMAPIYCSGHHLPLAKKIFNHIVFSKTNLNS